MKKLLLSLVLLLAFAGASSADRGDLFYNLDFADLVTPCDPGRLAGIKNATDATSCDDGGSTASACICDADGLGWSPADTDTATTPGGDDTEVQLNDGGSFAGADGLTYDTSSGTVTVTHQTDGASVQAFSLFGPDRATPAANDETYISLNLEGSLGNNEFSRITVVADDVTGGSEYGSLDFDLDIDGSLTPAFSIEVNTTDDLPMLLGNQLWSGEKAMFGWSGGDNGIGPEWTSDSVNIYTDGTRQIVVDQYGAMYRALGGGAWGWYLGDSQPTSTLISVGPDYDDANSGLGWTGHDSWTLVSGGVVLAQLYESSVDLVMFPTFIGIGGTTPALSTCIDDDGADRLYHDTDCDGVKDAGEEFLDLGTDASDLTAGTLADARVAESNVTQHEAALTVTESQISDLSHTTDAADLVSGVLADARVQETNVTQHEAALSITESQISDLAHFSVTDLDTDYGNETITSDFDFGGGTLGLPQGTDCSAVTGEGNACWDTDDDELCVGDGAACSAVGGGGGTPGGADTYVQVNEAGAFQGYDEFTFDNDGTSATLTLVGEATQAADLLTVTAIPAATSASLIVEADGDVLFPGNSATDATNLDHIRIGQDTVTLDTSSNGSVVIGNQAEVWSNEGVAIGFNAVAASSDGIAIGDGADATGSGAVSIGGGAYTATGYSVAIGPSADARTNSVAIGFSTECDAGGNAVGVGYNVGCDAADVVAIGYGADCDDADSICIGRSATSTAAGQLVFGNANAPILNAYIGEGVLTGSPQDLTVQNSGASGTDIAGGDVTLAAGAGTGAGNGGDLALSVAPPGGSGSSLNSYVEALKIPGSSTTKTVGVADNLGVGNVDAASAACIANDAADRLFHDTDCDNSKGAGEEYIDLSASTGIGGGYYGTLYEDASDGATAIVVSVQHTYYGWVSATAGPVSGLTADVADATADHLTIPADGAGEYFVSFDTSANITGSSGNVQVAVFVNGTEKPEIHAIEYESANSASRGIGGSGILTLAAGDEVALYFANRTNTSNLGVATAQLTVRRINNGIVPGVSGVQAQFRLSGDQAVASGAWDQIEWGVETADPLDWHDNSTNPSRITVDSDGFYYFSVMPRFTEAETANIRLIKNGAALDPGVQYTHILSTFERYGSSWYVEAEAGDYFEVDLFISGGATLDSGDDNANTNLVVTRIPSAPAYSGGQFHGYLASDSAVGTGDQQIAWTEDTDPFGWFDSGVSTSQVVVDRDGFYLLNGTIRWLNTTSAAACTFFLNGSRIWFAFDDVGASRSSHCSLVYPASAGDYFEMKSYHEGGTETRKGGLDDRTETHFWVTRLPTASTGGPAGNDTEVQFNDGGALAGASTITYDGDVTNLNLSYGEMYESGAGTTINLTTGGTYYGWVSASEGLVPATNYVDFTDNGTADRLTIGDDGAGVYSVNLSSSFSGSANEVIHMSLFVSGVEDTKCEGERKIGSGGDVGNAGFACLVDLDAADYVDVRYTAVNNTKSVTVTHSTLTISRVAR